ncbi:hypothetical protein CAPTEDRAFT_209280 [Capitella teleta]|uniref:Retrotransposon gag domain-containing protein n=1 Tax=Capitella teleta TaxID=283909 RepID=R7T9W9_CAPTE|nr:hypothetical protein CAPTEDRAFT_209280 [Capitella teleta]|eukprot:ELT87804.1 hypothetical protein CAPTEDRAFT_209280 [Capitella teleta]
MQLAISDDVSATERFIKRVGFCDGDKPSRTLEWLRAIDRLPDNVQVEIALHTAESTIHSSLRELKNAKWPKIKTLLANRYVNANFSEAQKEALDRLEQRPGEGLYNYITTFEVLLNEAYQALPLDQISLIRTFLSGLSDRDMAKSVARKKLRTLPEVVKEVRRHYQDNDLLRPRKISKVHAIDKYENPQVSALSVVVTDLVNMQKETNAQIAALAKEEGERLQAIRLAERILREYRSKQKETYRENEASRAKRLPPGTFVSVRILNPKKGETRWQPRYQVISSHDGALRVIELDTGDVVRINQRNVREIPESKPYDEINPLPPLKNQTTFDYVSFETKPISVVEESYLPTRIPRGPKRPSNDQPNLTTPSVPVPAV